MFRTLVLAGAVVASFVVPVDAARAAAPQRVLIDSFATTNYATGAFRVIGRVSPTPPNGRPVYLQRWVPEYRIWHGVATGYTSAGRVTINAQRPGSVTTYRLVTPARPGYAAGISANRSFANYVWRGAFARPMPRVSGDGAITLADPASNPRRDKATVLIFAGRQFYFYADAAGCRSVLSTVTGASGNQNPVSLRLEAAPTLRTVGTASAAPSTTVKMSGGLTSTERQVRMTNNNLNSTFDQTLHHSLLLLCAN